MIDFTEAKFRDDKAARKHLESLRWPDGPVCPHCGSVDSATKLKGKSTRPGVYKCRECAKPFSVTVGTVLERSKIPLHKWVLAFYLMTASKKGMSAHQLHRMLGITYKSAWFMAHRIREAMKELNPRPMGGGGKTVEADETYLPIKARNRRRKVFVNGKGWVSRGDDATRKIVTLVERGGRARSIHVPALTANAVSNILRQNVIRKETALMTDRAHIYKAVGKEFASHESVDHGRFEWGRGVVHTNTIEGFFSIFKRGMRGIYQHCSEAHLHRYLAEFDFRYSHRKISDADRAGEALRGIEGKRLQYRPVN